MATDSLAGRLEFQRQVYGPAPSSLENGADGPRPARGRASRDLRPYSAKPYSVNNYKPSYSQYDRRVASLNVSPIRERTPAGEANGAPEEVSRSVELPAGLRPMRGPAGAALRVSSRDPPSGWPREERTRPKPRAQSARAWQGSSGGTPAGSWALGGESGRVQSPQRGRRENGRGGGGGGARREQVLRALFRRLDADGSGTVEVGEVKDLLEGSEGGWYEFVQEMMYEEGVEGLSEDDFLLLGGGILDSLKPGAAEVKLSLVSRWLGSPGLSDSMSLVEATQHFDLLHELFDIMDMNGNGALELEELSATVAASGLPHDAAELMEEFDIDRSNALSRTEFAELVLAVWSHMEPAVRAAHVDNLQEAVTMTRAMRLLFNAWDSDGSGSLSVSELRAALGDVEPGTELAESLGQMERETAALSQADFVVFMRYAVGTLRPVAAARALKELFSRASTLGKGMATVSDGWTLAGALRKAEEEAEEERGEEEDE